MMQDRFLYKAKTTPKGRNNEFSNVWVYGNLIVSGGKVFIHPQCNRVDVKNEIGKLMIMHEVVAETICQCTGLKDETDTLIWEGDIIKLSDEDEYFVISWDDDTARFCMEGETMICDFDNYWSYQVEVVGNKFDNAELLEGEE